jgi:hypothetical protein
MVGKFAQPPTCGAVSALAGRLWDDLLAGRVIGPISGAPWPRAVLPGVTADPARGPAVAKTGCWFLLISGGAAKGAVPRQNGTGASFAGGNAERKAV